ncbi:MAG: hypothetical protein WKF94_09900 [Solirubrobacteraceae bacterium]
MPLRTWMYRRCVADLETTHVPLHLYRELAPHNSWTWLCSAMARSARTRTRACAPLERRSRERQAL